VPTEAFAESPDERQPGSLAGTARQGGDGLRSEEAGTEGSSSGIKLSRLFLKCSLTARAPAALTLSDVDRAPRKIRPNGHRSQASPGLPLVFGHFRRGTNVKPEVDA
jgi:hypothetical protein